MASENQIKLRAVASMGNDKLTDKKYTPADLQKERSDLADLRRQRDELLAALDGLFEHCFMCQKRWGDNNNAKEAHAAIAYAAAAMAEVRSQT